MVGILNSEPFRVPVSRHFQISVKTYILGDADADYQQFYSFCEEKYKYEEPDEPNFVTIAKEARLNRMKNSKVSSFSNLCEFGFNFEVFRAKSAP